MRVSVVGPVVACCHGVLRCHQFEAQQMILASAASVQLGSDGNAPQNERMTREENDAEMKGKEIPTLHRLGKNLNAVLLHYIFWKTQENF